MTPVSFGAPPRIIMSFLKPPIEGEIPGMLWIGFDNGYVVLIKGFLGANGALLIK